jgi:flagellar FliJ protein
VTRRSDRLLRVQRLRETEEQAERRRMGQAQRQLDAAAARLEELRAWRKSYAEQRGQLRELSGSHWQDYQRFLDRLDEAIAAQQRIVADGQRQRDALRRRWLASRRRSESLERVVATCREAEAEERARAEQRISDDLPRPPAPFLVPEPD